jgi:1-acyl-sn-glycerol-3-phosphate acyltransferase
VSGLPALGSQVPRRGSSLERAFGRAVLSLLRWRIAGEIPNLSRFVIAIAPHTSNWDFVIGIAAMFALDLRISFIGKHTLFRGPFAAVLKWMGGIAVDRSSPHGLVAESIAAFECAGGRVLAIAPEGTRHRVERFRSGFLHIARGARVPVLLASLDYAGRCLVLGPLIVPGEDVDSDRTRIEAHFARVRGRNPR